jgi:hypothetical protein
VSAPAVRRTRSPLAHGPGTDCPACRDCQSCDAGRRRIPRQYRPVLIPTPDGSVAARAHCTGCDGRHITCHNLVVAS